MAYQTLEDKSLLESLKDHPITLGLILRGSVENSAHLLREIQGREDIEIVFTRSSPGRLYISYYHPDEVRTRQKGSDWS